MCIPLLPTDAGYDLARMLFLDLVARVRGSTVESNGLGENKKTSNSD